MFYNSKGNCHILTAISFFEKFILIFAFFYIIMSDVVNIMIAHYNFNKYNSITISGCSAAGSAPALGAGCRRFKSCHSDQKKRRFSTFVGSLLFFILFSVVYSVSIFRLNIIPVTVFLYPINSIFKVCIYGLMYISEMCFSIFI